MDQIDRDVIGLLKEDARRSFGDVGERVGLSASAVKRRVDRLERSGVIRGYTVIVDESEMGRILQAFIELRFAGGVPVDGIESVAGHPNVEALFTIAGDPDALALVRVSDVAELKSTIDRLRRVTGVVGTKTLMVLGRSSGTTGQTFDPALNL